MGRRILMGFAALGCVFVIQPHSSGADDAQIAVQMVMPDALAAFERMGEHLKTFKQFTLSAATSEDVLDYGEKVMIGGDITYHVKSPDASRLAWRSVLSCTPCHLTACTRIMAWRIADAATSGISRIMRIPEFTMSS